MRGRLSVRRRGALEICGFIKASLIFVFCFLEAGDNQRRTEASAALRRSQESDLIPAEEADCCKDALCHCTRTRALEIRDKEINKQKKMWWQTDNRECDSAAAVDINNSSDNLKIQHVWMWRELLFIIISSPPHTLLNLILLKKSIIFKKLMWPLTPCWPLSRQTD